MTSNPECDCVRRGMAGGKARPLCPAHGLREAVDIAPCSHSNIIGCGHGQTMQCDDCGYVFPEVPS